MKKYIAYYRVSTKEQGQSNLGLSAQQELVRNFTNDGELIHEYKEVESGRNCNRIELHKAIEQSNKTGAILVIAKLDRLSRNVQFIYKLRDSGVNFVCADMPDANSLTIGLLAVLAEEEAKRTSERTSSALKVIKNKLLRGEEHISKSGRVVTRLGRAGGMTDDDRKKSAESRRSASILNPVNRQASAFIISLKNQGNNFNQITKQLNDAGFRTSKGNHYSYAQVQKLYDKFNAI